MMIHANIRYSDTHAHLFFLNRLHVCDVGELPVVIFFLLKRINISVRYE